MVSQNILDAQKKSTGVTSGAILHNHYSIKPASFQDLYLYVIRAILVEKEGICMAYYHCSPIPGLTALQPGKPKSFDKTAGVYMTTLLPMALMYSIRNYEYTYGYTKEGQIYLEEYFPNALEILYRGKTASLYLCDPESTASTRIPNEAVSEKQVPVIRETLIADACEALLEQERLGALVIRRYHELSEGMLAWIRKTEAECIRSLGLIGNPGPMADYYRIHYPESWAMVEAECK